GDVVEEEFVAGAEVVEAGFAVGSCEEAVLGALSVAGEADFALVAVAGQGVALGGSEAALLGRADERLHGRLHNVAQLIFRIDEVVAGVEVAVVLEGEGHAAVLAENTKALRHSEPAFESYVEDLDEGLADVAADPLVEDGAQEFSELQRLDGPLGDLGGV